MKRIAKILCAALIAVSLFGGSALAGVEGLEDALSAVLEDQQDAKLSVGFEVKTLLPFGEETIAMLNGVLKHIWLDANLTQQDTQMGLRVDQETLMTFHESTADGEARLTTSLLPNRVLTASENALDALFAVQEQEPAFLWPKAASEAETRYQALTDAIQPYAEEKKANYKIADVGYAKWVRLARLTPEQSGELLPQIIDLLGCGMDSAFREQLSTLTCKNGFTIALYRTKEDGEDLAVYMKGGVSLGEEDSRTLSYQWAFTRGEAQQKDSYKLEISRAKGAVEQRMVEAFYSLTREKGKLSVSQKNIITLKNGKDSQITTVKNTLKGSESEGKTTLEGTLSTTVKLAGEDSSSTTVTEITPQVAFTSAQGSAALSGKVGIVESNGKSTQKELLLTLDSQPAAQLTQAAAEGSLYAVENAEEDVTILIEGSSLAQNVEVAPQTAADDGAADFSVGQPPLGITAYSTPASLETVNLEQASPEEKSALLEELSQRAAGKLLIALAGVGDEDSLLLQDNLSEENYIAFLNAISGL